MLVSDRINRQYEAFWDRADAGRATFYITRWDGAPGYAAPKDLNQQWEDVGFRVGQAVYNVSHTVYEADAFPSTFVNFGPGCLSACIGGGYRLAPQTIWFGEAPLLIGDWDNAPAPALDEDSAMYRMIDAMTDGLLEHADKTVTSVTDIGGTYDVVASLRGTQNLLYDMYDHPDEVKTLRGQVATIWKAYYLRCSSRLIARQGGMSSWMPIWSEKTYYPLQCDYCAMISPKMFGEFILPDLRYQTEYLERSIYHLDGPGELPHVDQLLSLPRLNAIQWTSGDGNPRIDDPCWFDLYRRIQKAGKGLVLLGVDPKNVEDLFRHISQRGVFLASWTRDGKDTADLLSMCEKLNREYRD